MTLYPLSTAVCSLNIFCLTVAVTHSPLSPLPVVVDANAGRKEGLSAFYTILSSQSATPLPPDMDDDGVFLSLSSFIRETFGRTTGKSFL